MIDPDEPRPHGMNPAIFNGPCDCDECQLWDVLNRNDSDAHHRHERRPGTGILAGPDRNLLPDDHVQAAGRENTMKQSEEVQVEFTVECDDFTVPEWHGLECGATFNVHGYVELDDSGPVNTSRPSVMLLDPKEYTIAFNGEPLPEWLQQRLITDDAHLFDNAFLEAIGGQSKLDELAVEKAVGA